MESPYKILNELENEIKKEYAFSCVEMFKAISEEIEEEVKNEENK